MNARMAGLPAEHCFWIIGSMCKTDQCKMTDNIECRCYLNLFWSPLFLPSLSKKYIYIFHFQPEQGSNTGFITTGAFSGDISVTKAKLSLLWLLLCVSWWLQTTESLQKSFFSRLWRIQLGFNADVLACCEMLYNQTLLKLRWACGMFK